ncbi:MAG: hypothetical protein CMJ52_02145 [Planctomycetaceae bacterium]|nr:hypothetical protein [Planctomycetaceae bacterium]
MPKILIPKMMTSTMNCRFEEIQDLAKLTITTCQKNLHFMDQMIPLKKLILIGGEKQKENYFQHAMQINDSEDGINAIEKECEPLSNRKAFIGLLYF